MKLQELVNTIDLAVNQRDGSGLTTTDAPRAEAVLAGLGEEALPVCCCSSWLHSPVLWLSKRRCC